jgi:homoaconitase/3-isopropylmalate dehydratase large subunit
MHITGTQQGAFWTAVKDTVKRMIEKQRTNATSGCKKAFQGKFNRNLSVDTSMTA